MLGISSKSKSTFIFFLIVLHPISASAEPECERLDPRTSVKSDINAELEITARKLLILGTVEGKGKLDLKQEAENKFKDYPDANEADLKARLIYFICEQLKASDDLSDEEKINELKKFTEILLSSSELAPPNPLPAKRPWYKRWYVWAIAGGIAAAAIAASDGGGEGGEGGGSGGAGG